MIKLFQTVADLKYVKETTDELKELGVEGIEIAEIEIRHGKTIRVTRDEDDDETTYMAVVFDGGHVVGYTVAETETELNAWMIQMQKENKI